MPNLAAYMETSNRAEYARSRQMMGALREAFLYSEKRARDCVFIAVESSLASGTPASTLTTLIRSTLQAARNYARQISYDFLNSEIVTRAVFNALLRAGVLLDREGYAIPASLAAYATCVSALAPDFRDQTESFLVEFLIVTLGDVAPRDHMALAHVLFRQFDAAVPISELEDRLVTLITRMNDRIELSDTGIYMARHSMSGRAAGVT